jgi:hypothetical protein
MGFGYHVNYTRFRHNAYVNIGLESLKAVSSIRFARGYKRRPDQTKWSVHKSAVQEVSRKN